MKAICFLFLFAVSSVISNIDAQQIETDYFEAISQAREQKKGLLYLFIDGVGQKNFKRNFLNSNDFPKVASKFVILEVNCSKDQDENSKALMYCTRLTMSHNKNLVFPAVLATNNQFQPVGDLHVDFTRRSTESYLKFLNSL